MKPWTTALLFATVTAPLCSQAHAQWWPVIPMAPQPAKPEAPTPETDVVAWLKGLEEAKVGAEKAQQKGDFMARDGQLMVVAEWAAKIATPSDVKEAHWKKAIELVGELAREMATWKATFGTTKLTMLSVRHNDLLHKTNGAERARLLVYRGDIENAQSYPASALQSYAEVLKVPEAEEKLVKYAIERGVASTYATDDDLKPFYERMVALPLSPAERADWQLRQNIYIANTEYKGDAHDTALAAIKAIVYDTKAALPMRHLAAKTHYNKLYNAEDQRAFLADILKWTATVPIMQSHWLYERGQVNWNEKLWQRALDDLNEAVRLAPADTLEKDTALRSTALLRLAQFGAKLEVVPMLETVAKSPNLKKEERYDAAIRAGTLNAEAKKWTEAKANFLLARSIPEIDVWAQTKANINFIQCAIQAGDLDAASAAWQSIPFEKVKNPGASAENIVTRNAASQAGMQLYRAAVATKNFPVAQQVFDSLGKIADMKAGDQKLMEADLAVAQGQFDQGLTILRDLLTQAKTDQDKAFVNQLIAAVEKKKAEATIPGAPATDKPL